MATLAFLGRNSPVSCQPTGSSPRCAPLPDGVRDLAVELGLQVANVAGFTFGRDGAVAHYRSESLPAGVEHHIAGFCQPFALHRRSVG